MTTKNDILKYLSDMKSQLKKDGIERVGIFGSFASGKADLLSDIDLVIKTTKRFVNKYQGIKAFLYLEGLRENIKHTFKRDVDICDESGLKNKDIIKDAIYV